MEDYKTIALVLVVILICFYFSSNSSSRLTNDIVYDISAEGKARAKNDMMNCRLSIKSDLHNSTEESYKSITPTVDGIRKVLESDTSISNLVIKIRTDPEWQYSKGGEKNLLGYIATCNISYDIKVESTKEAIEATKLQNKLLSYSRNGVIVSIDYVDYFMSDDYLTKAEGIALKNAITRGKSNADILVSNINPGHSYVITNVTINNRGASNYPRYVASASNETVSRGSSNIIAQGESTVEVSISMKISVD